MAWMDRHHCEELAHDCLKAAQQLVGLQLCSIMLHARHACRDLLMTCGKIRDCHTCWVARTKLPRDLYPFSNCKVPQQMVSSHLYRMYIAP